MAEPAGPAVPDLILSFKPASAGIQPTTTMTNLTQTEMQEIRAGDIQPLTLPPREIDLPHLPGISPTILQWFADQARRDAQLSLQTNN